MDLPLALAMLMNIISIMIDNSVLIPGKCDLHCLFCLPPGTQAPPADTSLTSVINRVKEIKNHGVDEIFLGVGGFEPTAYPHLIEVIEHCRSEGFSSIKLSTNGILTADFGFLKKLAKAGITDVYITFFSASPEITDYICVSTKILEKKIRTVHNTMKLGLNLELNALLLSQSVREIPQILSLFHSMTKGNIKEGSKPLNISIAFPSYTGELMNYTMIVPTYEEFVYYVLNAIRGYPEWRFSTSNVPRCAFPKKMPLENIIVYFVKPLTSFNDPSEEYAADLFKFNKVSECAQCSDAKLCGGIPQVYLAVYPQFRPWKISDTKDENYLPSSSTASVSSDIMRPFLYSILKGLSHGGWNFSGIKIPDEKSLKVYYTKDDKIIAIGINSIEMEACGLYLTKEYSLFFDSPPDPSILPDAEILIKKIQELLLDIGK